MVASTDTTPILADDDFEIEAEETVNKDTTADDDTDLANHTDVECQMSNETHVETKVYVKRWYILAVFSFLGILQVSR